MKKYIKDGIVKSVGQIFIYKDDYKIYNPTEQQILDDGWEEYLPSAQDEPPVESTSQLDVEYWRDADYADEVNKMIRMRYTDSEEFAILRQRDTKPHEFDDYNNYCEYCKREVRNKINKANEQAI